MKKYVLALSLLSLAACEGKIEGEIPEGGLVVDVGQGPKTPTTPTDPTSPTGPTSPTNPTTPTTPGNGNVAPNPHTNDDRDDEAAGTDGQGGGLLDNNTPPVVVVTPTAPVELPGTPVPAASLEKTLICTGRGEPGLTFSSKVEFFSDGTRKFHFSLWNREAVIENFVAFESPGASQNYRPQSSDVGSPASSRVQHGFQQGYREFLGYAPSASIYQQLFVSDDRGGLELRVGQVGDNQKPEFFGLDAARCVKL